jgi:hypothetical protein
LLNKAIKPDARTLQLKAAKEVKKQGLAYYENPRPFESICR